MLKKTIIFMAVVLMFYSLNSIAADVPKVKKFTELKCKLTLPSSKFKWLDHSKIPNTRALFGDDSGIMVLLLAFKAPKGGAINETFIKEFDKGFCKSTGVSKINSDIIKFKKLPCYQLHIRISNGPVGTIRVFFANGYCYQLQLIGSKLPIKERAKLDKIFSSFEFIGVPSLPKPAVQSAKNKAHDFGRNMGRIAGYCIIAIIILAVFRKIKGKKKKVSQPEEG